MTTEPKILTADRAGRTVLRRWRGVQGFGGLLLAFSFFMPMISTCNSTLVPAEEVANNAMEWVENPGDFLVSSVLVVFASMMAPYLFGAMCAVIGFRGRRIGTAHQDRSGIPTAVLFILVAVIVTTLMSIVLFVDGVWPATIYEGVFTGFIFFSCWYAFLGVRRGAGGLLSLRWFAAMCGLLWFGYFGLAGMALRGLWVSMLGTGLIVMGVVMEARWLGGERVLPTLRRLLNCELEFFEIAGPRCRQCGYLLIGLSSGRCPECGTAIEHSRQVAEAFSGTTRAPASP
jgi:hypothetical protein